MLQTTRLSRLLAAILVVGFLCELFVPDTSTYIALVPGRTLPCVWNLVTNALLTVNPVELVVSIIGLLVLARLVEPIYGSKEFLRFILVVDLGVGSLIFAVAYLVYVSRVRSGSGKAGDLLYAEFSGFHGVLAGLLVAVKQIMPHSDLKLFGSYKLKVKFLPSVVLLLVCAVCAVLDRLDYLAFYITGTYVAWFYLRFLQPQAADDGWYGDDSDDFKFSSFFPDMVAPAVDAVANVLGIITRLRHVPGARLAASARTAAQAGYDPKAPSALGTDAAEANRRRERGAKALEERLGMKTAGGSSSPRDVASGGDVEAGQAEEVTEKAAQ